MARATHSFPVPDSPVTSTVLSVRAICSISLNTASIFSLRPTMFANWCVVPERTLQQHVLLPQLPLLECVAHLDLELVDVEGLAR